MFLKKLFRKDFRSHLEQGEKYLAEERYADARIAFAEALQSLPKGNDESGVEEGRIRERLRLAGDRLGALNLAEAEHALARGDMRRAADHLELVLTQAEDVTSREKAEKLLRSLDGDAPPASVTHGGHACTGCGAPEDKMPENVHVSDEALSAGDRFDILVHPLPGDLPQRYAELGEEFACAFLSAHEGNDAESLRMYEALLARQENDIILYETALIHYRRESLPECERLLRRAIGLNHLNPLCHLSLVQLFIDTERFAEALRHLEYMIAQNLLPEQSLLLAGDVSEHMGDQSHAVDMFTQALALPAVARAAAERLIPLLEQQGRSAEAQYLFKKYCKGCC
jgi:tetratricopeptide (TPR) repeat protein